MINMQAVYTDGATRYNFQSLAAVSYSMFGSTSLPGAYQSIGFASAPDAVYTGTSAATAPGSRTSRPGASAVVTPTTGIPTGTPASTVLMPRSSTATTARLSSARTRLLCWPWLVPATPTSTSRRSGIITRWTPVKNLTFSGDFTWTHLDQKYSGTIAAPTLAAVAKPAAVYELKDQDSFNFLLRAQRNF